jgi:hypothetical protein
VAALLVAVTRWGTEQRAFRDMVLLDNYALFFDLVICYAAALVVMLRWTISAAPAASPASTTAWCCSRRPA